MICHTSINIKLTAAFPYFFMVQGPPSTLGRFLFNLHLSQQARQRCRCHAWCRRLLSKRRNGAVSALGDQAAEEAAAQRTQLPGTDQLIANLGEPLGEPQGNPGGWGWSWSNLNKMLCKETMSSSECWPKLILVGACLLWSGARLLIYDFTQNLSS